MNLSTTYSINPQGELVWDAPFSGLYVVRGFAIWAYAPNRITPLLKPKW